jgi:hypothetical protein
MALILLSMQQFSSQRPEDESVILLGNPNFGFNSFDVGSAGWFA